MYGTYKSSVGAKILVTLCHTLAVAGVAWFFFGGGLDVTSAYVSTNESEAVRLRKILLLSLSLVYFLRLMITSFVMLQRTMDLGEGATVGVWVIVIHWTMAFQGGTNPAQVSALTWVGVALYVLGSYLNTGSEFQRLLWKKKPEHKGKLYTGGLFRYSMHINYFGDTVLFCGFALVAGQLWAAVIPLIMASMFVFLNIPMLDRYLAKRYGSEFEEYSKSTAKFIPFIY